MIVEIKTKFGVRFVDDHDDVWSVTDRTDTVLFTSEDYDEAVKWANENDVHGLITGSGEANET